jgi:RHS repeat-associated protein
VPPAPRKQLARREPSFEIPPAIHSAEVQCAPRNTAFHPLPGLLAEAWLTEKPHQGVRTQNATLHQAIAVSKPLTASGLQACGYDSGRRSRSTGKLRDNETGLDFFEARYFSGAQGRWTSPDAINLTDARVLNPSNTLNKYIYGGNNPLKYVDPDGRDITVFYTNSGPAGHFWMAAYDQDTDSFAVKDFGPSTDANPALKMLGVDVPGDMNYASHMKSADDVRKYASLTIQTNPEDTQRAIALMNDPTMNMNLNVYSWRGPNCTTVCRDILWQILGANAVGTGVRPIDLWSALFKYYNHGAKVQSAPGKDYGKPRYPTDPFTFVWYELEKQRKPQKPHVTSKIHYDVKPSGEKHCSAGALNGSGEGC